MKGDRFANRVPNMSPARRSLDGVNGFRPPTGHVFRLERARGPVWYAKYRLPDGRQVQKKIGPAWTERGRPAAGYYTKRLAEAWLRAVLDEARRGVLPGMVRTGVVFDDAAAEWLRYVEKDRLRKASTLATYRSLLRSQISPTFGSMPLETITPTMIEQWVGAMDRTPATRTKALAMMHGIFKRATRVWGLPTNPTRDVEKPPLSRGGDIEVFSPEEVWALVRAAKSEQDAAIFLTAAFTGLRRGELIALKWRDVDFAGSVVRVRASYHEGVLSTPKSGKVRSVPLAPDVAEVLARLGSRSDFVSDEDLVFVGDQGGYLDASALRRRYGAALERAGLRRLRFHDLRHTFGTRMIGKADIRRVQEWMGHADVQTTMKYLHYSPRAEDARLVSEAFALDSAPTGRTSSDISGHLGTSSASDASEADRENERGL
jgi:integrase